MKSAYWINKASEALGHPTARSLAERLDMNEATLSQHKSGRALTLSEERCLLIAQILDIDPARVLMDQAEERAKSPELKKQFARLGKLVATPAGVAVAVTICLTSSTGKAAGTIAYASIEAGRYILCKMERLWSLIAHHEQIGATAYGT